MLLSQKLANFSKGDADVLRKAMGKKIRSKLDDLKPMFLAGCAANNLNTAKCEKIWIDWEKFAEYAFNKPCQLIMWCVCNLLSIDIFSHTFNVASSRIF